MNGNRSDKIGESVGDETVRPIVERYADRFKRTFKRKPGVEAPDAAPGAEEDPSRCWPAAGPESSAPGKRPQFRVGRLQSTTFHVSEESVLEKQLSELEKHQDRNDGKLFCVAGLPRHGKSTLVKRLYQRHAERMRIDVTYYDKTETGQVNIYVLPGKTGERNVLLDMAGEDFQILGEAGEPLPEIMNAFLWPLLQRLDGMALLMALPMVWSGWNDRDRQELTPAEVERIQDAEDRMVDAHITLLKYARAAREHPEMETAPNHEEVDGLSGRSRKYDRPVAVVLSKADLYKRDRAGLRTPSPGRNGGPPVRRLVPGKTHPLQAAEYFRGFRDYLHKGVRHFKWSFCQALEDSSPDADAEDAEDDAQRGTESLVGGEGVIDFLARHPWAVPGLSSASAMWLDRLVRRMERQDSA